jgi:hypothetical protein
MTYVCKHRSKQEYIVFQGNFSEILLWSALCKKAPFPNARGCVVHCVKERNMYNHIHDLINNLDLLLKVNTFQLFLATNIFSAKGCSF